MLDRTEEGLHKISATFPSRDGGDQDGLTTFAWTGGRRNPVNDSKSCDRSRGEQGEKVG